MLCHSSTVIHRISIATVPDAVRESAVVARGEDVARGAYLLHVAQSLQHYRLYNLTDTVVID